MRPRSLSLGKEEEENSLADEQALSRLFSLASIFKLH
jgi:hypothetical protein